MKRVAPSLWKHVLRTVLTAGKAVEHEKNPRSVEHYQVRRQRNFQPFPKAVANPKSKPEDPLRGVSAELHKMRGKGKRMYEVWW